MEGENKHLYSLYKSERCEITTYLSEISSVNFPSVRERLIKQYIPHLFISYEFWNTGHIINKKEHSCSLLLRESGR